MKSDEKKPIEELYEIPPVPMVGMKIVRLLDNSGSNIHAVQEAIMADQTLAARILSVANSAYYSSGRKISTISDAIMTMGYGTLRNLVLAASTRDVYRSFGLIEQKLWEHSIGVSVAAAVIAREIRYSGVEEASIAGLLHDIGKVVMDNKDQGKFALLYEAVHTERVPYHIKESFFFQHGHAAIGGMLTKKWGFPNKLSNVIKRHHFFRSAGDLGDLAPDEATLCAIVILGDSLCVRLGVGYDGPMGDLHLPEKESREMLDIDQSRFDEITAIFRREYIEEKLNYQSDDEIS